MKRRNFFKVLGALFVAPATVTLGAVAVKPKARMIPEWSSLEITGTDAYGDAQDVWVFQKNWEKQPFLFNVQNYPIWPVDPVWHMVPEKDLPWPYKGMRASVDKFGIKCKIFTCKVKEDGKFVERKGYVTRHPLLNNFNTKDKWVLVRVEQQYEQEYYERQRKAVEWLWSNREKRKLDMIA